MRTDSHVYRMICYGNSHMTTVNGMICYGNRQESYDYSIQNDLLWEQTVMYIG